MDKIEIGKLLTLAAGFDNRKVDRMTVEAWALVPEMAGADYEAAKAAVVAHQTGPNRSEYLTVGHIVAALRLGGRSTVAAVEADVRSAKARGLIESSWQPRAPLPTDVADALFTLREGERRAAAERFEFDQLEGVPVDVGEVGLRP
ncbi:hypothetical protein ASC66_01155 [Leifsonia sp. Root4]|uniref:hypothetical protein n=1 Tax=Leifsonia sp. Root4 TaxID=1736525 RepID=UPI0006FE373A|nr:hypothetical protein [Leifsonia sp. Root4]KQW07636.1 hypothetical protein ASC66_01155 [Leifsonia sp. Root4]